MRIIRDQPKEMEVEEEPREFTAADFRYIFKGDNDENLSHPLCSGSPQGDREDCTVEVLLSEIQKSLTYKPTEENRPLEKDVSVEISFMVNEFGNIKNIKVQYSGDSRLKQAIIQALYSIPRMSPAMKDGAPAPSECMIIYPYDAIFGE